jgi:hypothetical protein
MNFESQLEELRKEINAMSKKIIHLRFLYKSLKKSYFQSLAKSKPVKNGLSHTSLFERVNSDENLKRFFKDE